MKWCVAFMITPTESEAPAHAAIDVDVHVPPAYWNLLLAAIQVYLTQLLLHVAVAMSVAVPGKPLALAL